MEAKDTLFVSSTSPYSRKVHILILLHKLENSFIFETLHPVQDTETLRKATPLSRVPALQLASGDLLVNSPIIARHIDTYAAAVHGRNSLIFMGEESQTIASVEAIADGLTDCAYLYVMESNRPVNEQSAFWKERWLEGISRSLTYIENNSRCLQTIAKKNLAAIAVLCAYEYLDFRLSHLALTSKHTKTLEAISHLKDNSAIAQTRPS